MFFSRLLGAVLVANILTMAFCNLTRIRTHSILFVYPVFLAVALLFIFQVSLKKVPFNITSGMILWVMFFICMLASIRIYYIVEWLCGNIVKAMVCDDYQRLCGLISMTLSEQFPLKHFANQDYLFSYYYAAMIPLMFAKFVFPLITLKSIIFLGNLSYYFLILFSLLEIANLFLRNKFSIWILVFLCTMFGGLDWIVDIIFGKNSLVAHHEWWSMNFFKGNAQVSSYFTGLLWTSLSHFTAFIACILSFVFLKYFRFRSKTLKSLFVGLLLISATYSSVFVVIPAVLFCVIEFNLLRTRFFQTKIILPLAVVFFLPLFVLNNIELSNLHFTLATFRLPFSGNMLLDKILSFPIWIVLVPLAEFCLIPYFILFMLKKLALKERLYFYAAVIFFISTYLITDSQHNYCMRGMFLPTFVFFILFAKYTPLSENIKKLKVGFLGVSAIFLITLFFSIGTLYELKYLAFTQLRNSTRVLPGALTAEGYRKIMHDPAILFYRPQKDETCPRYYLIEKMIYIPLEKMSYLEQEQMGSAIHAPNMLNTSAIRIANHW